MQGPYTEIARVLHGARRRRRLIVAVTALGWGGMAAGLFLLAGAVGMGVGPGGMAPWLRPSALALGAASVLGAAAWAGWLLWRTAGDEPAVVATVAAGDESLRSALLSAVELGRERSSLQERGLSAALADEHVARTGERARGIDLSRAVPDRPARRAGLALLGALAAWGVAAAVLGPGLARGVARLASTGAPSAGPPRAEPVTGDVELTYLYPAHTGRPERTVPGSDGAVQAPRGTEVRLATRSDRPVKGARIAIDGAGPGAHREVELRVVDGRALSGSFVVDEPGSYRFQFTDGARVVVTGPPIPVTVEPDAFPEVRVTAPAGEVEVASDARVHVEWTASDDYGLGDLTLVLKPPGGEEERRRLRSLAPARRQSGELDLDLAPLRLAEGERLLYWLEVVDNDTVSGPKRAASATRAVKIFSEAEHHQKLLAEARRHWEEMVRLLGDRLEQLPRGQPPDVARVQKGLVLDGRTRQLHEGMREAARALRKDRGAPGDVAAALANVAAGIRERELPTTATRQSLLRQLQFGRPGELGPARRADELDDALDRELEKDVLYLEQLFDKQRAEDLVRMAKDLASRRRELASLLERYRQAPTEQARKELLAQVARMRSRMQDMLRQMSELARGVSDSHMNAEALAEVGKGRDLDQGMKQVEDLLARGDVDAALKELDAMGNALQEMMASLERTAGRPDERTAALSRKVREFERDLESVERDQKQLAAETEKIRGEQRRGAQDRIRRAEPALRRIEQLARQAQEELRRSSGGTAPRSEDDFNQAKDRLDDLGRALEVRDLDAALDASRRAVPPLERLATGLEDEALMAERFAQLRRRDPAALREAAEHARDALPPARQARDELQRLLPDARTALPQGARQRLDRLAGEQQGLEQRAGRLQQQLERLAEEAPVFPPQAMQDLGAGRDHMQSAASELGRKEAQRGLSQQREALGALDRLRKGLEQMARSGGKGGGSGGFPFPFAEASSPGQEGGEGEPSREKVEIPQGDASRTREQFRRDLLEAMKQGTPDAYQGEVKRYYEELVK